MAYWSGYQFRPVLDANTIVTGFCPCFPVFTVACAAISLDGFCFVAAGASEIFHVR